MILQKQKTYKDVLDRACRQFAACSLEERAEKACVRFTEAEGGALEIPFFDEDILLKLPDFRFESRQGHNVTLAAKVLILHYLLTASGHPLSGHRISYEDIPGCRAYMPVFERRVCRGLLAAFGYDRDLFLAAGRQLGGREEEFGNASFTLRAFPMVPITFVLWEGDSEFSPSLKVLFDSTIDGYLPLEDITVVSRLAATRILHAARIEALE